ncbi:hypothetical protein [Vibrio parahaemolyticus]|uniref:hypothetical protein n=1 Tax=Vibrio parahaemolyticus TaxID=670 RepID=UPI0007DC3E77|nr:hypothetical protein [Vibrio parahaemolyticus]AVW95407.1 hypothetical protein DA442_09740 [Vibrio parahaemolyticus]EGQ8739631.1 hypothetical protein [Vibrio parahaemolyticus]EGQ8907635.1 hypothetical protein [Vibrio parahaemolyticus]EGR3101793.1 hypothetical protein [Vibrio parahaemolyticus]EHK9177464.1 hypothetical protein [Vibrio parahaemolyticus]
MSSTDIEQLKRRMEIFSTPLDVEKYIADGIMSRYKNTKTQFVIHCSKNELPEEINARANKLQVISNKDGSTTLVLGLNLKVRK